MKKLLRISVELYHLFIPSFVGTCRFRPTCSQYLLDAINKYGFIKGGWRSARRIASCHPFSKRPIYDPV